MYSITQNVSLLSLHVQCIYDWIRRAFFFFFSLAMNKKTSPFTIWLQHVGVAMPDVTTAAFLCPACSYHCMYWYTASGVISCIIKENFIVCVVPYLSPVWVYLIFLEVIKLNNCWYGDGRQRITSLWSPFPKKNWLYIFLYISFQSYRIYIRRGSLICVALEIVPLF